MFALRLCQTQAIFFDFIARQKKLNECGTARKIYNTFLYITKIKLKKSQVYCATLNFESGTAPFEVCHTQLSVAQQIKQFSEYFIKDFAKVCHTSHSQAIESGTGVSVQIPPKIADLCHTQF